MFWRKHLVNTGSTTAEKRSARTVPDKDPTETLRLEKNGLYPVIRIRDHTLMVDVNGSNNVVPIDTVLLPKTCNKVSPSSTLASLAQPDEDLLSSRFPPQHSAYEKSQANTRTARGSGNVKNLKEPSTRSTVMATYQTRTHRNSSTTFCNILWSNINVGNSAHWFRLLKPTACNGE